MDRVKLRRFQRLARPIGVSRASRDHVAARQEGAALRGGRGGTIGVISATRLGRGNDLLVLEWVHGPGVATSPYHNRNRELERGATPRRAHGRACVPFRHAHDRPSGRTAPPGPRSDSPGQNACLPARQDRVERVVSEPLIGRSHLSTQRWGCCWGGLVGRRSGLRGVVRAVARWRGCRRSCGSGVRCRCALAAAGRGLSKGEVVLLSFSLDFP